MAIQITNLNPKCREITDDENPRIYKKEYLCLCCKAWVDEEETVWVNPITGKANTGVNSAPYHVDCAPPEQKVANRKMTSPKV